jgi:hypothetical protein
MPRDGAIICDLEGKLDVLRVKCAKCPRHGLYILKRQPNRYAVIGRHALVGVI